MKNSRSSKITIEILRAVATGAALLYVAGSSKKGAWKVDKMIGRALSRHARYYIKKKILELEKQRIVSLGGEKIRLTARGRAILSRVGVIEMEIETHKWDGLWRLVSYDIPNINHKRRDIFRNSLEKLGFVQVQESLFCIPWRCKELIAVLAKRCEVAPYVIFMQTDHLPTERSLQRHFNVSR